MQVKISPSFYEFCSRIFIILLIVLESKKCKGNRRKHEPPPMFSLDSSPSAHLKLPSADLLHVPASNSIYSPWSDWGPCSRRCIQRRERHCLNSKLCDKSIYKERRTCRSNSCSSRQILTKQKKATGKRIEEIIYELLYYDWSEWSACTRSCKKRRYRTCALKSWCRNTVLLEERKCSVAGGKCHKKRKEEEDEEDMEESKHPKKHHHGQSMEQSGEGESEADPPTIPYNASLCGIREVSRGTPRIVGGYESQRGSWPWQVAILTKWHEQYCAGVLISPTWVITAAHCVRRKRRRRKILVRVGEHDLSTDEGPEMDIRIEKDFIHSDFDIDTIDNDIALLKLKTPVGRSMYIGFACLPKPDWDLPKDTLCYAVGWGKMKETHLFGTDVLREAPVPIVDRQKCQEAFDYGISENQLCAGYKKGGKDTCAGDSGGPLMCEVESPHGGRRWTVYGVTSYGEGCGDRGKYGIYSNITSFLPWVKSVTGL